MRLRKIVWQTFFWALVILAVLLNFSLVHADEVVLKDGQKFKGIILSNNEEEVALQINSKWRVFKKTEVESVNVWSDAKNSKVRSGWQLRGFWGRLKEAVSGGPQGILRFVKPYHYKFMRWTSGTKIYKLLMKISFFNEYKQENAIGFAMSIYCIWLLILAFVLKVIKELILLVLSFFGVTTDK